MFANIQLKSQDREVQLLAKRPFVQIQPFTPQSYAEAAKQTIVVEDAETLARAFDWDQRPLTTHIEPHTRGRDAIKTRKRAHRTDVAE